MNKLRRFVFSVTFLSLLSCSDSAFYRADTNTPNGWSLTEVAEFKIEDTLKKPSDLYIYLRNDLDYPYANIFIVGSLLQGDSLIQIDTLEYMMAKPNGEWLGTGFLSVKESKLIWKEQWVPAFPPPYTLTLAQANRATNEVNGAEKLEGIVSVGVSVEPTE